jgi:predicted protein tyrosine phosphatase
MTTQEALKLANALDKYRTPPEAAQAAAELRRLHEANQELLEVLKEILDGEGKSFRNIWEQARAAIAKAEGGAA